MKWKKPFSYDAFIRRRFIFCVFLIFFGFICTNISSRVQQEDEFGFLQSGKESWSNCSKLNPDDELNTCIPSILVAGYEKCGTSALYHILQRHPSVLGHPTNKENCPTDGDSESSYTSWLQHPDMVKLNDSELDKKLHVINGCLGIHKLPNILSKINENVKNLKILISVRDISEFAFSYYNYRCYEGIDTDCSDLAKPNSAGLWKQSRSPQNFVNLIKDIQHGKYFQGFGFIKPNMRLYRTLLDPLYSIVREDQVLVLKQEDLRDNPEFSLRKIATFLNIEFSEFPQEAFNIRSNTGNKPNQVFERKKDQKFTSSVPAYARKVLQGFWDQECKHLPDYYDIDYRNC